MTARRPYVLPILAALAITAPGTAQAQTGDPTLRDSFSIGSQGGSLCEVQATVRDSVIKGMFDRAWVIVCRDASQPVGYVRMLRATPAEARARIEDLLHDLRRSYTIVIVTHNMQQAVRVSDFTAFLHLGKLVEFAPTEELFTNPREKLTDSYLRGTFS